MQLWDITGDVPLEKAKPLVFSQEFVFNLSKRHLQKYVHIPFIVSWSVTQVFAAFPGRPWSIWIFCIKFPAQDDELITSEVHALSRAWSVLLRGTKLCRNRLFFFFGQCFLVFYAQPQPDSKQSFQDLSPIQKMKCFCLLPRCTSAAMKDDLLNPSLRLNDRTGFSIYVKMGKASLVWFVLKFFLSTHLHMGKYTAGVNHTYADASAIHNMHSHAVYFSAFLTKRVATAVLGVSIAACMTG